METWQEEMSQRAEEAAWYATLSGAYGWCIDEGDEFRRATVEFSSLDGLAAARAGYWGEFAQAEANSKDVKRQKAVAEFGVRSARSAGLKVIDVDNGKFGKNEFRARRDAGVEQLLKHGRFATRRDAELEWMMREAEVETGFTRDEPNLARREKVRRKYRALCNRDRRS